MSGEDSIRNSDFDPPFEVLEPLRLATPLIFNSPHSGRVYPAAFLAASRLDALTLRRSEDAFVDELFAPCVAVGAPLMWANFPRAYLDLNREPYELDPLMFEGALPAFANTRSLRVAGGLGTIPRVVGESQAIYRTTMPAAQAMARIAQLYSPYHAALQSLVDRACARFGVAVLIDCHSMPSGVDYGAPDFVIGDRYGASAASWIVETIEAALANSGYIVRRNKPYAGGYITERYGAPVEGRHSVQIEINRKLYMDERRIAKYSHWRQVSADLAAMAQALARRVASGLARPPIAAE
jgi:N-formylglutamate amidohydrolase